MVVVGLPRLVWSSKSAPLMKSKQLDGEHDRSSGLLMLWCALMWTVGQCVIMCVRLWVVVIRVYRIR